MKVVAAWLPACSYMALIWVASSIPHDIDLSAVPLHDKGVHLVEYGVLGVLLARALVRGWPTLPRLRALLGAVALAGLWGYLDEVHQAFVPGRHADAWDLVADVVGACLGTLAYALLLRLGRARGARA